jgi:hypothetical protein
MMIDRGLTHFTVAPLLRKLGAPIRDIFDRRLGLMFTLFGVILPQGFDLGLFL